MDIVPGRTYRFRKDTSTRVIVADAASRKEILRRLADGWELELEPVQAAAPPVEPSPPPAPSPPPVTESPQPVPTLDATEPAQRVSVVPDGRPRILHVFKRFMWGGAERIFRTLMHAMPEYGFFACSSRNNHYEFDLSGYMHTTIFDASADTEFGQAVAGYAKAIDARIIHCTTLSRHIRRGIKWACSIPVVDSYYNQVNWDDDGDYANEPLDAAVSIVPSVCANEDVPIHFIPQAADGQQFRWTNSPSATIGFLARMGLAKNAAGFSRIAKALHERYPAVRCIWIGGAGQVEIDEEYADWWANNDGHVAVTGITSRPEAWLAGLDALLIPSDIEGGPLCALEAVCCGVPVYGYRVGMLPQWADEGHAVTLCDDEADLVAKVGKHIERVARAPQGRKRAIARRAIPLGGARMVNAYRALYVSLLNSPLVSLLMPAWNVAAYIRQAIASVQRLRYPNWELCIADDASEDETLAYAQTAAEADARIKVATIPKGGYALAFNAALAMATGDLIGRLDADDTTHPYRLSWQVAYLQAHPECDIVSCGANEMSTDAKQYRPIPVVGMNKDTYLDWRKPRSPGGPVSGSLVARRSVYERLGGFESAFNDSADSHWNVRGLGPPGNKRLTTSLQWGHVPVLLYNIRHHRDRMTQRVFASQRKAYYRAIETFFPCTS